MKKIIFLAFIAMTFTNCTKETVRYKNPNIPNYSFSTTINANLPSYSGLNSPVNPIYISQDGVGVNGIIVMKVSETDFRAWEANCPNHPISSCARMKINGINAKCSCDDAEFSIFTGVGPGQYPMKPYAVEILGNNTIRIYN